MAALRSLILLSVGDLWLLDLYGQGALESPVVCASLGKRNSDVLLLQHCLHHHSLLLTWVFGK